MSIACRTCKWCTGTITHAATFADGSSAFVCRGHTKMLRGPGKEKEIEMLRSLVPIFGPAVQPTARNQPALISGVKRPDRHSSAAPAPLYPRPHGVYVPKVKQAPRRRLTNAQLIGMSPAQLKTQERYLGAKTDQSSLKELERVKAEILRRSMII